MFVNSAFSALLKLFNANNVRVLIIGGFQYAEPRYTKDLNIWISVDKNNAAAVYKSVKEFDAPLTGLTEFDFPEERYSYQMGGHPSRVDIFMGIPGIDFEKAWQRRVEVDFDELTVLFIPQVDLIASKKASGRPQDLIDVDLLSQISDEDNL